MRNRAEAEAKAKELVSRMTLEEKASQLRYDAPAVDRLGIPAYNWWNEVLHGVARAGTATVFPQAIGLAAMFDEDLQEKIKTLEEASADNTGLHFQVAINYGSRDEIIRAVNRIAEDVQNSKVDTPITESVFEDYLDTKGIPAPDLLIRTSGEQRLSNFLLWQLAYAEFYFTDVHWPDFSKEELIKACEAYSKRDRRYGGHSKEE